MAIEAVRRRMLAAVAAALAVATVIGLVALWPRGDADTRAEELGLTSQRFTAQVVSVGEDACSYSTSDKPQRCRTVVVRPDTGPDASTAVALPEFNVADEFSVRLAVGEQIVVGYDSSTGDYFFADRDRRWPLRVLGLLFAAAVVLLGRVRGVTALIALGLTVGVLVQFIVPAVLAGESPLLVALVGASAVAFLVLYLANGFGSMTTVALVGTLASLLLTAFLAWVFFKAARFTGSVDEDAAYLRVLTGRVDIRGLLLGGTIIGALGALDDMTVTQASAVYELRAAAPDMPRRALYRAAMRIGRDHVGSTVNTLLLAYAGASMPLLLLFSLSDQSLGMVANSETVAVEIVRTLVGSIGLVAAVPITTALATWIVAPAPPAGRSADHLGAAPPGRAQ